MAAHASDVNGFKAANLQNNTDFTIKLGNHSWKVQAHLLSSKSGFFRVGCTGDFKEAHEKLVELHDDNIWDFGRLLQFIYLGEFHVAGSKDNESLPLAEIVQQGDVTTQEEQKTDRKTSHIDVCQAMLGLADKYDVASLKDHIARVLFSSLKVEFDEDREVTFLRNCPKVLDMLRPVLSSMPDLEDSFVALLVRHKVYCFDTDFRPYEIESLMPEAGVKRKREQDSKLPQDALKDQFQQKTAKIMLSNPSFALKLATQLEKMLNKSMEMHKWTSKQKELLQPDVAFPLK